ncbi:unnamed protein product [Polarella glacialis]|uniref:Amino acid transporter transmembrane domain-containing protein n=1 Tax=Polarella glacialis TaxID=89957 RepID=A0A813GA20_POLGL|nr:unnamed protein product [Polarella glacialis]CAE8733422.1 unnamed protein product [Polarella glacialis]
MGIEAGSSKLLLRAALLDAPGKWAGVEEKLTFWEATISLSVSMLGTGIVVFPYSFALCGYVVGPIALIALGVLAYLSFLSLIRCTAKMHVTSYAGLLQALPSAWGHYTNASLWLLLVLTSAAYVLVTSDIIRSFALRDDAEVPVVLQSPILFAVVLAVSFPFCLCKSLHGLSATSAYCSFAIVAAVALILNDLCEIARGDPLPPSLAVTGSAQPRSVVIALPILGCGMFGHMNTSQMYAELQSDVKPKAHRIALLCCMIAVAMYMLVGAAGYAAFGRGTQPDILAQIAARRGESLSVVLIQGLLASYVMLKTPLLILPLRSLTLMLFHPTSAAGPPDLSGRSHVALTFALLACVYAAAIAMPDLGQLLQLLGAVCVIPICFVVPARLAWTIEVPRPTPRCLVMASVGILASALSLLQSIVA